MCATYSRNLRTVILCKCKQLFHCIYLTKLSHTLVTHNCFKNNFPFIFKNISSLFVCLNKCVSNKYKPVVANSSSVNFFSQLFQSLYKAFAFEEAMKATYEVESQKLHNNVC